MYIYISLTLLFIVFFCHILLMLCRHERRAENGTERFNLLGVVHTQCYRHRRDQLLTTDDHRMGFFYSFFLVRFFIDGDGCYDDGRRSSLLVLEQLFFSLLFYLLHIYIYTQLGPLRSTSSSHVHYL
jgi:hypothetical protein